MQPAAIALDIGGTTIKYGLVNLNGAILWESLSPTPHTSADAVVGELLRCIREIQALGTMPAPTAIGIGTPGMVNVETGTVLGSAFQLPGWENLPLAGLLRAETGLPVFVDNDANLMGLGEFTFGTVTKGKNVLFFTLGTGIGGAIFINGALYRGSKNAGGELGYIPFNYRDQEGYWEDFASMKALAEQYTAQNPDTPPSAKLVFERAAAGDHAARKLIRENAHLVGRGIAGYINIFNPDTIIIGGGVSDSQRDYIEQVKHEAFKYALPDCSNGLDIVAASLGNKAGMIGAGYFALSRLDGIPMTSN